MSLESVSYTDPEGRKKMVLLPVGAPKEDADMGIPVGPPSFEELNLPSDMEIRLNNELFNRGVITQNDALRKRGEIILALQSVYKVDAEKVVMQYLGHDYKNAKVEKHREERPETTVPRNRAPRNRRRR